MNRMMNLVVSLFTVTLIFASFAGTARADDLSDPAAYSEAMTDFLPVVTQWTEWVAMADDELDSNPGTGELAELDALARLGYGMAADLAGTADLAPGALKDRHDALTQAVERMSDAATRAAAGKPDAFATVADDVATAEQAMFALRTWLLRDTFVPGSLVPGPGASNS